MRDLRIKNSNDSRLACLALRRACLASRLACLALILECLALILTCLALILACLALILACLALRRACLTLRDASDLSLEVTLKTDSTSYCPVGGQDARSLMLSFGAPRRPTRAGRCERPGRRWPR